MIRPAWLLQQIVPPLGLTYFFTCWRICTFDLGPGYITAISKSQYIGYAYSIFATISISLLTLLYLKLYFLPHYQSTPPFNPPIPIRTKEGIYECLSPLESTTVHLASLTKSISSTETTPLIVPGQSPTPIGLVNRCYRDSCAGRWKPPRTRHCSLCKTCRGGFDHHCAIFANCLTAPYIPTFLSLLLCTPPTVLSLIAPMAIPLLKRSREAWVMACEDEGIKGKWWDWGASWIIAGGPMGRWVGGLVLGWKILDRADGGGKEGEVRLQIGILVFLGLLFSAICLALAIATIQVILEGHLTVDRERFRTHLRIRRAIHTLQTKGLPIPPALIEKMERYADRRWFFVPVSDHPEGGVVSPTLPHERAYDLRRAKNWETIMGRGWNWVLPWNALRRGMKMDDVCQWPIASEVEERLRNEAEKITKTNGIE